LWVAITVTVVVIGLPVKLEAVNDGILYSGEGGNGGVGGLLVPNPISNGADVHENVLFDRLVKFIADTTAPLQ
jgi:hypothetical protein